MKIRSRLRNRALIVLALLGVSLLAGAAWGLVTAQSAVNHLQQAQTFSGGLAAAPDKPAQLARIRTELAGARSDLEALGTVYDAAAWLRPAWLAIPLLGPRIEGATHLLQAARLLLRPAAGGLDAAIQLLPPSDSASPPADLTASALTWIDQHRTLVLAWARDLDQASDEWAQVPLEIVPERWRPAFADLGSALAAAAPLFRSLDTALDPALDALGLHAPRTYLLLFQNNLELRPTGGFIGLYGLARLDKGSVVELEMHDVYDFPFDETLKEGFPAPPQPLHDFLGVPVLAFQDVNWSPDFPTVAATAAEYYTREFDASPDGVIAVNFALMRRLLRVFGPLQIGGNEPVTADNLYSQYLAQRQEDKITSSSGYKDRFALLAQALLDRARQGDSVLPAARAVWEGLTEKDILLALPQPALQGVLRQMNWDGAIAPGAGDYISINDANLSGFKISADLAQEAAAYIHLAPGGMVRTTLVMTLTNSISNTQRLYRRIYLPGAAELEMFEMQITDAGQPVAAAYVDWENNRVSTQTVDDPDGFLFRRIGSRPFQLGDAARRFGKTFIGVPLAVPKNAGEIRMRLTYQTPNLVRRGEAGQEYRLQVQKQPGALAFPFSIQVSLPRGATPTAFRPALESLPPDPYPAAFDLARDQEIVVRFR